MAGRKAASFPKPGHNHDACAARALAQADQLCRTRKVRFTPVRRQVLEAIWDSHAPIGAYDILAKMNAGGARNAPMAVYRALDFLLAQGLVHRVQSQNAFIGCPHPGDDHDSQLLLCRKCGSVAEINSAPLAAALSQAAPGFLVEQRVVEISGLCPHCKDNRHE
jgi:Fur family zinc uptake transcriptional regulator